LIYSLHGDFNTVFETNERVFLLKIPDCMAEQMLSRHERAAEDKTAE